MRTTKLLFLTALLAGTLPSAFAEPLHHAIAKGDVAEVCRLLASGANIEDQSDPYCCGDTPLRRAALMGKAAIVDVLLKKGANVESRSGRNDQTPLMGAAMCGELETARALLKHGANINAQAKNGDTALSNALATGRHEEMVDLLLGHGASITREDLRRAVFAGNISILQRLLNKTGDIDKDLGGLNMLMMACVYKKYQVAAFLVEKGANVLTKTPDGRDVLAFCKDENVRRIIEEAKQKQESAGIVYWLSRTNYESPALTEALITAETSQLPDWLTSATVQQKVALLTDVKKQLARASVRIDELNAEASAAIAGKQDPVPFRKRAGQIKAYINVLNEIKAILEQS